VAAVLGAAIAAIVLSGAHTPRRLLPPQRAIVANATLVPRAARFGDIIRARVDVRFDRRRIEARRIEVETNVSPYGRVDRSVATSSDGNLGELVVTETLRCLTASCVPAGARLRIGLDPALVHYVERGGHRDTVSAGFPAFFVSSWLDRQGDELRTGKFFNANLVPDWRAEDDVLPRPTYSIAPGLLLPLLIAVAALLLAAAAGVAYPLLPASARRWGVGAPKTLPPLERALALVEHARAEGQEREERKALDLLARELRRRGVPELAGAAHELAWSRAAPGADATTTLAGEVRALTNGSGNGHRA
jgi:hypothetical protein